MEFLYWEPHITLQPIQLANESCRGTVSIDTTTPVDRHPRVLQTEDSAQSLQPTPIEDLCDKFSSLSSPGLSLINALDYAKTASLDNKPRVPRKLVSPVALAGDEKSVDRHTWVSIDTRSCSNQIRFHTALEGEEAATILHHSAHILNSAKSSYWLKTSS